MKEKINYIDYSKGIAILFVIFGHVYSGNNIATTWIYSFHIPLFFIISGFLLKLNKNKDTKSMILKKFKSLMVPYILFSIINIVGFYLIKDLSYEVFKGNIFNTITLFGIGALWFLPALFISETLFLFEKNNIGNKIFRALRSGSSAVVAFTGNVFCRVAYCRRERLSAAAGIAAVAGVFNRFPEIRTGPRRGTVPRRFPHRFSRRPDPAFWPALPARNRRPWNRPRTRSDRGSIRRSTSGSFDPRRFSSG